MKRAALRSVRFIPLTFVVSLPLGACSLVATFDDRPSRDGDSSRSDGAAPGEDARESDGGEPAPYPNGCPGHAGPVPIKAAGVCIDSTEVTNAHYAEFLEANRTNAGPQAAPCAWNTTFVPESAWPADGARASFPVVQVDWCDAHAFCAWAGKRLCGSITGGSSLPEAFNRVTDQWFLACSTGATRAYPYAGGYSDDACNGNDHDVRKAVAVGTMPTCEGGFDGLFDMSGNVAEWQDACTGSTGASDPCFVRGGHYESSAGKLACAASAVDTRAAAHSEIGFRCCGP